MPLRAHKTIPELSEKQISRFWSKVDIRGPKECWLWSDPTPATNKGYGIFTIDGANFKAHRIALFLKTGKDPGDLCTLHTCDVRACCNGDHLFQGTNLDNIMDKVSKGRQQIGIKTSNLTPEKVQQIRRLHILGLSYRSIAKIYGCGKTAVEKIINGKNWKYIL